MKIINPLTQDKWLDFKKLRLIALKTDPRSFASTYEEENAKPDNFWQDRINNPDIQILVADNNGQLVGSLVIQYNSKPRMSHWVELHGVYVKPEYRNQGLASQLLTTALSELAAKPTIVKIKLNVAAENIRAIALYEKFGFRQVGILEKEDFFNGVYLNEIAMEKLIK